MFNIDADAALSWWKEKVGRGAEDLAVEVYVLIPRVILRIFDVHALCPYRNRRLVDKALELQVKHLLLLVRD